MSDVEDYDGVVECIEKLVDEWSKKIKDAAKELADAKAELDKMEALKKQREQAAKDAQKASEELTRKIFAVKVSPKADPKPFSGLPQVVQKAIKQGGIPLGDTGVTLVPSNWKFSPPPKFKVESGGITLKVEF